MGTLKVENVFLLGIVLAFLLGACSGNLSQTGSSPAASQIESSNIDKNAASFVSLEADSAPLTATFNTVQCMAEGFDLIRCDLQVMRLTPTEGRVRNEAVVSRDANPQDTWTAALECTYTLDGASYVYFSGTFNVTLEGPWSDDINDSYETLKNGLDRNGDRLCPGSFAP